MNKSILFILMLNFLGQSGYCQKNDPILTPDTFLGIKLGETNFKDAGELLKKYSYKKPDLHFRSIRWRGGACTILLTHQYFVKIGKSRLHVTMYGNNLVNRIVINSNSITELSYHNLILGKSRIREIKFIGENWDEIVDSNGQSYLTNKFDGIRVDIPGDTTEVLNRKWSNKKINRITLIKDQG